MKKVYDRINDRLICYRRNANDSFWDEHWSKSSISNVYKSISKYNLVLLITKKYLNPQDGPILEGGCGIGQFVYSLSKANYKCVGIDFAKNTVKRAKKLNLKLDLRVMDIRKLDFPDNFFAGYWSMGVIEHFFDGYDDILNEMYRVLMPGGFIFITVPVISRLRKLKILLGQYIEISDNKHKLLNFSDFYQFILNRKKIINDFRNVGLNLVEIRNKGGIKGLKDEILILKVLFTHILELRNQNVFTKAMVKFLDIILSPITGHMALFVFKKEIYSRK